MTNIETGTAIVKADAGNPSPDPVLAKYAAAIRCLGKRIREDAVAIGRYLDQAQKHAGRGAWLAWIQAEFGWSDQTAYNFIHLHRAEGTPEFQKFWSAGLPLSGLYPLAAPNTPSEAREEIIQRIDAGEKPTVADIKEAVVRAKGKKNDGSVKAEPEDVDEDDTPKPSAKTSKPKSAPKRRLPRASNDVEQDDEQILRDLVVEEFFARASGADIHDKIPGTRLTAVCREFLDKLTVDGMRNVMSEGFGQELRRKMAAAKEAKHSARQSRWKPDRPYKHTMNLKANSAHTRGSRSRH